MNKKKMIITGAIALAILIVLGFLTNYLVSVNRYKDAVTHITFDHADASNVPDGSYIGECDVQFIYAKVEVQVEDGKITGIQLLEHKNERGKAAEGIEKEIAARQKIDVDVIAGATNSSQVIKKAVDNALSKAQGK
jgi:uncharacterized protein with FMN-binding domain